jgi:hypothetical protein
MHVDTASFVKMTADVERLAADVAAMRAELAALVEPVAMVRTLEQVRAEVHASLRSRRPRQPGHLRLVGGEGRS